MSKFELEKEWRHHLGQEKVAEWVRLVTQIRGVSEAVILHDYIVTVQVSNKSLASLYS